VSSELLRVIGADGETDRFTITLAFTLLVGVAKSGLQVSHARVNDGEAETDVVSNGEEAAASTSENSNTECGSRRSLFQGVTFSDVGVEEDDDNCICDDTRERGGAGRPRFCLEGFELSLAEGEVGQCEDGCRCSRVPGVPPDDPPLLCCMTAGTF
jgi:hypothetical protein